MLGDHIMSLTVYNNELIAGGSDQGPTGHSTHAIARWNGKQWNALASGVGGFDGLVKGLCTHNNELIVGGHFTIAGNQASGYLARWGPSPSCPADIAHGCGDGEVNVDDLLTVINAWGPCQGCPADAVQNGTVDAFDLLAVIDAWGPCP